MKLKYIIIDFIMFILEIILIISFHLITTGIFFCKENALPELKNSCQYCYFFGIKLHLNFIIDFLIFLTIILLILSNIGLILLLNNYLKVKYSLLILTNHKKLEVFSFEN